jgi:hypothetical protein
MRLAVGAAGPSSRTRTINLVRGPAIQNLRPKHRGPMRLSGICTQRLPPAESEMWPAGAPHRTVSAVVRTVARVDLAMQRRAFTVCVREGHGDG